MDFLTQVREDLATQIAARAAALAAFEAVTAKAVEEKRSALTPEETAEFEAREHDLDLHDLEIARLEAEEARLAALAARARTAKDVPFTVVTRDKTPEKATHRSVSMLGDSEARTGALDVLERTDKAKLGELRSDQLDQLDRLLRTKNGDTDGRVIAERMLLTMNDDYRSAFAKAATGRKEMLTSDESRALAEFSEWEARAMSSTTTAGGFGVPVEIDPTIIQTSQGNVPVVLQICRHEVVTTDKWRGVSSAGVSWSYDEEITEVSDDAPTLAQPTVDIWETRGFVPFSNRIGMDYPNFAMEVGELLMAGYLDQAASVTATGSGSTQPFGILTAIDATAASEVTPGTDGALNPTDIGKVWTALPAKFRDTATWVMSADVAEEIAGFGTSDNYAFQTSRLGDAVTQTLRGRPVKYSDYFPSFTGSTGAANLLIVGDFRNYIWASRAGMTVEYVPHLFGTSNPGRPTGSRGLFAWARNGGDSVNDRAFRLLQNQ